MKNLLLTSVLASCFSMGMFAQTITVPEPEFVHRYYHLTSDSTFNTLPKEHGEFKKHESKFSKLAKIGGKIADAAGSIGLGVAGIGASAGSIGTVVGGIQAANAAGGVASAVGTLDILGGMSGMDIVFPNKQSSYSIPSGQPVRIIVREQDNQQDPLDIMRIVKFKKGKKDRKIQWMVLSSSVLGSEEASKNGYLAFDGEKYGDSSYLITVPTQNLEPGEYGIIIGNAVQATVIPVATFRVD